MNRLHMLLVALTASVLLSGCASGGHCMGEFDYQKAYSLPQVTVADVKQPASSASLVVPPKPARIVPFGQLVDDPKRPGKTVSECLDNPPGLPSLPAAPAGQPAKS